jgi:hypothetical protein
MNMFYESKSLPLHWVVEIGGAWWIVPAVANGWARRTPYEGHRQGLIAVKPYMGIGLGIPAAETSEVGISPR